MNPFLVVLIAYSLLLVGLGLWEGRRVREASDFFVAGRRLGTGLLFSTLLAANIGAGSTVGAAGLGYRLGLSAWWWVGSAGIGSLILAFTLGPRLNRLSARYNLLTVGDYLQRRYDATMRSAVAVLLWLGSLAILAGQFIAMAWILNLVVGTTKVMGCLIGGAVVVIYFAAGGLQGAARINRLQLLVKGTGFLLAVPLVISAIGGWEQIETRILQQSTPAPGYFSLTGIGAGGIFHYLILLVPAFIISPGLLQKIYGARDTATVRRGVGLQGLMLLIFAFFPVLLGMAAAASHPGLDNPELALPTVIAELLPFWLGALLMAAVFSAELSSADAVLFMLSTSLSRDLYQSYINPAVSPDRLLRVSRWVSVFSGVLAIGLAIVLPSVIDALTLFYSLISVSLFAPLVLGVYYRFCNVRSAKACLFTSVPLTVIVHWWTGGDGWTIFSPTAIGILAGLVVMLAWRPPSPTR